MFHILYGFLGASEVNAKGAIMENRSQPVFTILSSLMAWLIRKASRYISIKMATGGYSRRGKTPVGGAIGRAPPGPVVVDDGILRVAGGEQNLDIRPYPESLVR